MEAWFTHFRHSNAGRYLLIGVSTVVFSCTTEVVPASAKQLLAPSVHTLSLARMSAAHPSSQRAYPLNTLPIQSLGNDVIPPQTDSNAKAGGGEPEEPIVTDRPDQTEAPQLTPRGWFQFEFGVQSESDEDERLGSKVQALLYNTTLWKYGLSNNVELRLITEFAEERRTVKTAANTDSSTILTGFNPVAVGLKIALEKEDGILPDISLITHLELPYLGSEEFRPEFVIPRFRFLFAHTLSDQFTLSYNLGSEWEDGTSATTGIYTVSLGATLTERIAMFVEAYGFMKEKYYPDHRVDAGINYQLTNHVQFDASGGFGLNDISPDYFISAGLPLRFKAFH